MERAEPLDLAGTSGTDLEQARTVVLIDDHPVVALGIRLAFQEKRRFLLADVATCRAEAVSAIQRLQPDIVICDLVYDTTIEHDLIRDCRRLLPSSALVVFSSLPAKIYGRAALKAGADRFVPKEQPLETLIAVLEELEACRLAPAHAQTRVGRASLATDAVKEDVYFTGREVEIGRRLSLGLSVARIGQDLGLSANTVSVHRDNIRKKLNCRDSSELIAQLARLYPAEIRHG